jgi:WD40 repeat protein
VWDIADPTRPIRQGEALTGPQNYVFTLDFQPDTHLLAAGALDNTIWLWDLEVPDDPVHYGTLSASGSPVNTVEFSPDGRHLLSAGSDQLIYVWDIDPTTVTDWVCSTTGDDLTTDEWSRLLSDIPRRPVCGTA